MMSRIEVEYTEGVGARIFASIPLMCPVCGVATTPNVEHLCGDRAPKPAPKKGRKACQKS